MIHKKNTKSTAPIWFISKSNRLYDIRNISSFSQSIIIPRNQSQFFLNKLIMISREYFKLIEDYFNKFKILVNKYAITVKAGRLEKKI